MFLMELITHAPVELSSSTGIYTWEANFFDDWPVTGIQAQKVFELTIVQR